MINTSDFLLGDVLIEPLRGVISKKGLEERRVEPQIMAVLLRLSQDPGNVVTREDMLSSVWPDCVVNDGVLSKAMSVLRKALGDNARHPIFIQTIPKVGYRLIAPVYPVSTSSIQELTPSRLPLVEPNKFVPNLLLQEKPYSFRLSARSTLRYVLPAVIIGLLFMFRPKHVEIEEEITYRSPTGYVESFTDSSKAAVDSAFTEITME